MEDQFIIALKNLGPIGIFLAVLITWYIKYYLPMQIRKEEIISAINAKRDLFIENLIKNSYETSERIIKDFRSDIKEMQDKFVIALDKLMEKKI